MYMLFKNGGVGVAHKGQWCLAVFLFLDWTNNQVFGAHVTSLWWSHFNDVIMGATASQIPSLMLVYSTVYSGADQGRHQSSASLAFVWGIDRAPVNSPHKWPVTRKMFPFDDVIIPSWGNRLAPGKYSYDSPHSRYPVLPKTARRRYATSVKVVLSLVAPRSWLKTGDTSKSHPSRRIGPPSLLVNIVALQSRALCLLWAPRRRWNI